MRRGSNLQPSVPEAENDIAAQFQQECLHLSDKAANLRFHDPSANFLIRSGHQGIAPPIYVSPPHPPTATAPQLADIHQVLVHAISGNY